MKKILFYVVILITLFGCKKEDAETPKEIIPEFKDYSVIKSDNWEDKIGQEITVEGYLIPVAENTYKIVTDIYYAKLNSILPDESYILVQISPTPETESAFTEFNTLSGERISATGLLAKFQPRNSLDESLNYSTEFLGSKHLATIVLKTLPLKLGGKKYEMATKNLSDIIDINAIRQLPENRTKFALLYSGGIDAMQAYSHYYNNIRIMYNLLLKQGYNAHNIVVVYKDGMPEGNIPSTLAPFFTTYPPIPVDYPATPAGLDAAIDYLKKTMSGQNAELFIMTTNHGGGYHPILRQNYGYNDANNDEPAKDTYKVDETLSYYNTGWVISDDQFAQKINSLPFVTLKALFLQCFSGGFIHDLRGANRILISATSEYEPSWGGGEYNLDNFFMNFISPITIFGSSPVNSIVDANKDGILTMNEIFLAAEALKKGDNNESPEYSSNPQYDDNGDGIPNTPTANGFGSKITF